MTDTTGKTRADLILAAGMIPLLHGAQEADDNDQHDDEQPDGQTPDPQDGQTPDPDDGDDDADGDDDGDEQVDVPELKERLAEAEADAARYKRRLLASDARKKQVERELSEARKQQARKPKGDDDAQERTPEPDDAVARENADLKRKLADLTVRRQFDDVTKYQWQNPVAAYRLLDLADVRQDDGTVDADDLADAVDALAKANPYLVKDGTSSTPARPRADRPSGQQPGTGRKPATTDKVALAQKFPALRGRI